MLTTYNVHAYISCALLQVPCAMGDDGCGFLVLVETAGVNAEHDSDKLATTVETAFESGLCSDGVMAQVHATLT
jgi:hypothetical protein